MSHQLKIKFLSLAAEARVIKAQEKRTLAKMRKRRAKQKPVDNLKFQWNSMRDHRRQWVRPEARATHLARAFIKGVPYAKVEDPEKTTKPLPATRITQLVRSYASGKFPDNGHRTPFEQLDDWVAGVDTSDIPEVESLAGFTQKRLEPKAS